MAEIGTPSEIPTELQVFTVLPKGCILHLVNGPFTAPLLKVGEFAVVDTSEREPVHDAVFLIQWNNQRRGVVQVVGRIMSGLIDQSAGRDSLKHLPPTLAWSMHPILRPRSSAELEQWLRERRPLACGEGPILTDGLRSKLVGRVVGLFKSGFDEHSLKATNFTSDVFGRRELP